MARRAKLTFLLAAALWVCAALAFSAEDEAEPMPGPDDVGKRAKEAKKIGPHRYQLGKVIIDAKERTVRCPGAINMDKGGPIELLACLPEGKVHESVLVLDTDALDLQVALLLLGPEPGRNPAVNYHKDDPIWKQKPGDMVDVHVEWTEDAGEGEEKRVVRRRADELIYNVVKDRPMKATQWVFVGSRWAEGRFGAALTGTLISTYYDPFAILELPLDEVNDDVWYAVNEKTTPPVNTKIDLVIQAPAKDEDAEEKDEKPKE